MDEVPAPARNGGSVEPANRAAVAKERFQTPIDLVGERYEVRDPFAEVTYRARTSQEMAAKAEQLGAIRFYAVDPTTRRPVNVAAEVELQVCKGELQNTRILASETTRRAETARSAAVRIAEQSVTAACSRHSDAGTTAVYTILFPFGSTEVQVPSSSAAELIERARLAELIVARGRTDGDVETAAESRIARERAAAVRAYLVQSGIDPARIRTSYQPVGDHAANNSTAAGRALNRRVEIEIYSAPPQVVALNTVTRP